MSGEQAVRAGDRRNTAFDRGGKGFWRRVCLQGLRNDSGDDRQNVLYPVIELTQEQPGPLFGALTFADLQGNRDEVVIAPLSVSDDGHAVMYPYGRAVLAQNSVLRFEWLAVAAGLIEAFHDGVNIFGIDELPPVQLP